MRMPYLRELNIDLDVLLNVKLNLNNFEPLIEFKFKLNLLFAKSFIL